MQFSTAITALFASVALAAPSVARAEVKSMMAAAEWTIESLKRTVNADDSVATWEFGIDTQSGAATACKFDVSGHPASQTGLAAPATCGDFQVTTGWSDQFGADNGFTTLSVVNTATKLIVWPSYTDAQLANGAVVTPDQSYTPANLS
ncbi:small secreted protein [Truncatella angustata]|uniref:Small secreted protein n=1 Tax=Truncatella angustata TaxID=152316 RepID=A0A9P9A554_9PEZI|nr:small secreted protein [Truncatella angustata]KAH6660544.1 small secreted protein [Truncatella angustata]KAH8204413.1 hypothetical protein TruAng_001464 [Truncatella angustata]